MQDMSRYKIFLNVLLTFYTCSIGIPFKGRWTDTHGPVVVNAANCGGSALFKGARITAFLSNACKVQRTLWIRYTFRFGCWNINMR